MNYKTHLKKKSNNKYNLYIQKWKNGTFAQDETGIYQFFPAHVNPEGYMDEWYLTLILNILQKLNKKNVAVPD